MNRKQWLYSACAVLMAACVGRAQAPPDPGSDSKLAVQPTPKAWSGGSMTLPDPAEGGPAGSEVCVVAAPAVTDGLTLFDTSGAETEGASHALCNFFAATGPDIYNDVWYNYTATATGLTNVSLCGSEYDTKVVVYDGCGTCDAGMLDSTLLACNDDYCAFESEVEFPTTAGNCYKIRVGGWSPGDEGPGQLLITPNATPCVVTAPGGATPEPPPAMGPCALGFENDTVNGGCFALNAGAPPPAFQSLACGETVAGAISAGLDPSGTAVTRDRDWFTVTLATESLIHVTGMAEAPTNVFIREGTCPPGGAEPTLVAQTLDVPPCTPISIAACVAAGTYFIRIESWNGGLYACPTDYHLTLNCVAGGDPPINDSCFSPIALSPNTTTSHNNFCATNDGFDTLFGCTYADDTQPPPFLGSPIIGADVWFSYSQPNSGMVLVSLCGGPNFDSVLEVSSGCFSPTIACDDDFCTGVGTGSASQVEFMATANTPYIIRVGGFGSDPDAAVGEFDIFVGDAVSPVSVATSNPPDGHLDTLDTGSGAMVTAGIGGAGTAVQGGVQYATVSVTFDGPVSGGLQNADITVACTGGTCPTASIMSGTGAGPYEIALSSVIPPLHCTTISFVGAKFTAGQQLQYRFSPGNVDLSSAANTQDLLNLILALNNGAAAANPARYNVNRSGVANTQDLLRIIQLLNGVLTNQVYNQQSVAACP